MVKDNEKHVIQKINGRWWEMVAIPRGGRIPWVGVHVFVDRYKTVIEDIKAGIQFYIKDLIVNQRSPTKWANTYSPGDEATKIQACWLLRIMPDYGAEIDGLGELCP